MSVLVFKAARAVRDAFTLSQGKGSRIVQACSMEVRVDCKAPATWWRHGRRRRAVELRFPKPAHVYHKLRRLLNATSAARRTRIAEESQAAKERALTASQYDAELFAQNGSDF
jgi:hypothetical protein